MIFVALDVFGVNYNMFLRFKDNKARIKDLELCFRKLNDTYFSYYSITKKIIVFKPLLSPISYLALHLVVTCM